MLLLKCIQKKKKYESIILLRNVGEINLQLGYLCQDEIRESHFENMRWE